MNQCEFCQELQGLPGNRFGAMYAGIAASRIVAQTEHFVVLPTIGQLFAGSLLILPRVHKETCAELQRTQQEGLAAILKRVTTTIRQFGWGFFRARREVPYRWQLRYLSCSPSRRTPPGAR